MSLPQEPPTRTSLDSPYFVPGLALAALVTTVLGAFEYGAPGAVMSLMAWTLLSVIGLLWASLRALIGETKMLAADALALGAPRAEEEQKRAVLRAMKDLEFERSVGKISEDDYQVLNRRYRQEAKTLLRAIDQQSEEGRRRAQVEVDRYLASIGLSAPGPTAADAPPADAAPNAAAPEGEMPTPGPTPESAPGAASDAPSAGTPPEHDPASPEAALPNESATDTKEGGAS